MTIFALRSLIRESLLLEEVYGAQATVYHGTKADPKKLISALLNDEFRPGLGAGSMYGKGLYTVYDSENTNTLEGIYGDHVIKLKVNLYGYIIFDPDIALKVYKKPLTPAQQAKEFGYSDGVIRALRNEKSHEEVEFTSYIALPVFRSIQHEVKGLVFTGSNDGRVVVVYDPTTAVPMAWKRVANDGMGRKAYANDPWTPVNRADLLKPIDRPDIISREDQPAQQSAIRRSAMGDFEAGKFDLSVMLKRLERLPKDQRIVRGDLNLSKTQITSLPEGLKVDGMLNLYKTQITSLPPGLQVGGDLYLFGVPCASLPANLRVGGNLTLDYTLVESIPDGLSVGGTLFLNNTPIKSLPKNLKVGKSLQLSYTTITSLPEGLQVGDELFLYSSSITSLPKGLKVRGEINVESTPITSLPDDLEAGSISGFKYKYWSNVPDHLKGKLR